jgi:hypothetical protein
MKTYLFLCAFIYAIFNINAQSSTIVFDQHKGLNATIKGELADIYHKMNDLNYHYFNLVSKEEKMQYNAAKLLQKSKARAATITNFYNTEQNVSTQNLVVVYGGQTPMLSLYKPKSILSPSGEIVLEASDKQCFDFNTGSQYPIVSNSGNTFYFPPNAFETLNGKQLINKNITICLWEFSDKKSLVYSGITTSSNGKMLETAGSFYIEASYNNEELKLRNGESYIVKMPSITNHNDMYTYYGDIKSDNINWNIDKNEPAPFNNASNLQQEISMNYDEYGDVIEGDYYEGEEAVDFYELSAGKLGWINCDRFYEIKNPATLAIQVDSKKNIVVRLVFRGINSVLPAYSNSNHKDQYEAAGIPKGEKVLLLAYSVKDDNTVFGYKEIIVGENKIENITLSNLSKSRFKGAISELLSF